MKTLLVIATLLLASPVWAQQQLPETPGAVVKIVQSPEGGSLEQLPLPAAKGKQLGKVADSKFWAVHGVMFASAISAAELTTRCMDDHFCTAVPDALRSRGALYGVGIPAAIGVTSLGYYLKTRGHRWWFVPAALVTAGSIVYGVHASQNIR
ncbi:MAG: hypothetical protein ACE14M_12300 [Terriglobales bacterium]